MSALYEQIELPLVPVLGAMEAVGIRVDTYRLAEIAAKLADQVEELEARCHELAGGPFVIGSPKQLGEVLFERLGLPSDRRGKTGYSTDARVLAKIRHLHPIVDVVEQWREQSKLLNTYLVPLPDLIDPADGRLHTTFSQTTAATGRLSSIRPNLQNIPIRTPLGREIRSAFVAGDGFKLLSADYSQVELRILTHLSGEPALHEAFARGEDIHRVTAAQVLGKPAAELTRDERNKAKAVNFGIIYGISSFGLSEQLGISREEAQSFIDTYLARFPRVNEFIAATVERAKADGYVTTLFGRRRPIPELRAIELPDAQPGRAPGGEHGHAGQRGRHHQGGDDQRAPAPARRGPALAAGAADPRRAAVRGGRRRGVGAARARRRGDDGRLSARPAARGRRRRGRDLAGGEMTWTQISGTISALPARRGDEPGTYLWIDAGERDEHVVAELYLPAVAADDARLRAGRRHGQRALRRRRPHGRGAARVRPRPRRPRCRLGAGRRSRLRHRLRAQPPSARGRLLPPLRRRARRRGGGGDHAARRRRDRDAVRPLHSMRFLTALAAIVAVLVAVSCEGHSAATEPAGLRRPAPAGRAARLRPGAAAVGCDRAAA